MVYVFRLVFRLDGWKVLYVGSLVLFSVSVGVVVGVGVVVEVVLFVVGVLVLL